jgi:hypothetical protein
LTHIASYFRLIFLTAVLIGAAVLLSACAGNSTPPLASESPQPTRDNQTEIAVEVAAALTGTANPQQAATPDGRPTLPPTWTPTFTPTPAPPTATITPTLTPTVTETLSAQAICDNFFTTTNLDSGDIFAWDNTITLYVDNVPSDVSVSFMMTHHFSGENRGVNMPGGQGSIVQLLVKNLPQTGQYDWTLVIESPEYGDICAQDGWFIAAGRNSTRPEEARMR